MSFLSVTRFSLSRLQQLRLAPAVQSILHIVGLPTYGVAKLYFGIEGGVELPYLSEWAGLKNELPVLEQTYIVLGTTGLNDECPICLSETTEQIVLLSLEPQFLTQFINSSLLQLWGVLNSYEMLVNEAMFTAGDEAYRENRVPVELISSFAAAIEQIDPPALIPGTFWAEEINRLQQGFNAFSQLPKYRFELWGRISDEPQSLHLKEATLLAPPAVLRAMAQFLSDCADGIEEHGELWEHEHLRDSWAEWYSVYPDFIVYQPKPSKK